ncbi:MAG: alpha/beta fold hydrolase [Deltaproteobacteria bacterium]|jgi:esterase/lipase/1-acyl-sn-glycerol-3-phosphate acyltransferase
MTEINRLALSLSKLGIQALARWFKASVRVYGAENIPDGVIIFAVNHFTRLETLILPYEFYRLTGKPVMSLAYHGLFTGPLGTYLDNIGAVSTKDPNRDKIIIRSLLIGDHPWLIFPEGSMIKDKKIIESGKFLIYSTTGTRRPPHTGAAALALRTEFYRRRLQHLQEANPNLLEQLLEVFDLSSPEQVSKKETFLVPVNISYYPIRSRQNAIEKIASYLVKDMPDRLVEELQTEGTMLLSGVDIDITIDKPLAIRPFLRKRMIEKDIRTPRPIMPDDVLPSRPAMRLIASKLTRKVMASIYQNAMVNYDHLIAYILKYYPGQKLSFFSLAQRLYLAVEAVTRLKSVRLHSGLLQDQCVQLCRNYHKVLADFLEVAKRSGAVEVEGDLIQLKRPAMKTLFDFHSIRRENPYQVILNEVEYLRPLTRKVRIIAEHSDRLVRWRLRRKFLRIAKQEFDFDYAAYWREGESKPKNIGSPNFYRKLRPKAGILLVHGYLAAPEEMRPLAEYLHRQGYTVFAPRLRGHGTSPEDLALRTWEDWLQSVERGYMILANSAKDVVLGGFSMGAGLALFAATNMPYKVKAVFAINCAMRLRRRTAKLAPAVVLWNRLVDKLVKDEGRRHFVPNEPENPHINYFRNPISGVKELMELMEQLSHRLDRIKVSTLVIQSSEDPVVHPEGSKEIYENLGSEDKELIMFNSDRHGILRGEVSQRVFARVAEFLQSRI